MKLPVSFLIALTAAPVLAEGTRQLDSHEHGTALLNIGVDGTSVAMEFEAPGSDIVGFEYIPQSDADKASVAAAIATLSDPLALFQLPQAAGCTVTSAEAELEGGDHNDHDDHDDHKDHDDHDHDKHDHDEHKDHDDHKDHDHEGHDGHEDHAEGETHTEFHGAYAMTCSDPAALTSITFAYFDAFENAQSVDVQLVSPAGATAFDVDRAAPVLSLKDAL